MSLQQQPPSIPEQFARPVPTQTQPAPADALNRPGPYNAQPLKAPTISPPSTLPPSASIPAAPVVGGAAAGGGIVLPAAILSVPLAVAGGETGRPITSNEQEKQALERARNGGMPDPFRPFRPAPNPSDPAPRPPGSPAAPKNPKKPPIAPQRGTLGTWTVLGRTTAGSFDLTEPLSFTGRALDTFSFRGSDSGFDLINQAGEVIYPAWSTTGPNRGGNVSLVSAVFQPGLPQPPGNPAPPPGPPANNPPPAQPAPNPAKPRIPPNPNQPNQPAPPQTNPTIPDPVNPNPTLPKTPPTEPNPTIPNPVNPNPTLPGQPQPNQPNPTIPNPVNPNPTLPGQPQPNQPNPTIPNPTLPNPTIPSQPGPLVPRIPGPISPSQPGPLVPRIPVPIGPSNPKPDPCLDPCVANAVDKLETVVIRVKQFVDCERKVFGVPFPFDPVDVSVPKSFANAFALMLNNQADVLYAAECKDCDDNVAAVPDWWGTRLGAERPQLMVQFARKFNDGKWDKPKYAMSIPYWKLDKEQTRNFSFPVYQKGSIQSALILPDNSKLIVNAIDIPEGERVLAAISSGMDRALVAAAEQTYSLRRGRELREITVYPRIARFFSTGQRNLNPDWSTKFP